MDVFSVLGTLFCGVLFVAVLVLGIVSAIKAQQRAAARRTSLAGHAAQREWDYRPSDPGLVGRFHGDPFDLGFQRQATNVVLGRHDGRHFAAFDYRYSTSSGIGDNRTTRHTHCSVLAMSLGAVSPGLAVRPVADRRGLLKGVPLHSIPTGNAAFDQLFVVSSPSPEFARDVLHPGVIEVLLHHPQLGWRLEGDSMLVIRFGEHSVEEIEAKLHFMDAVLDRIPEHVRARLLGERPR